MSGEEENDQDEKYKRIAVAGVDSELWSKFEDWIKAEYGQVYGHKGEGLNTMLQTFLSLKAEKIKKYSPGVSQEEFDNLTNKVEELSKSLERIKDVPTLIKLLKDILKILADAYELDQLREGAMELLNLLK